MQQFGEFQKIYPTKAKHIIYMKIRLAANHAVSVLRSGLFSNFCFGTFFIVFVVRKHNSFVLYFLLLNSYQIDHSFLWHLIIFAQTQSHQNKGLVHLIRKLDLQRSYLKMKQARNVIDVSVITNLVDIFANKLFKIDPTSLSSKAQISWEGNKNLEKFLTLLRLF